LSQGQNVTVDVLIGSKCHCGRSELGRFVQASKQCTGTRWVGKHQFSKSLEIYQGLKTHRNRNIFNANRTKNTCVTLVDYHYSRMTIL
jgi:hypothetical protein